MRPSTSSAGAGPASAAAATTDSAPSIARTLREAAELAEVGLALLEVRVLAFLSFGGEVVEQRRVAGELLQPRLPVAVGVERRLEAAQRDRAHREHLAAPLHGFRFQLLVGYDAVDEPHLECLRGVVLAAQEPDLARLLLPDDARHVRRTEAAVEAADFRPRLAEARVVGGDGEFADHVQHVAAADRVACDHRDHGLRQRADLPLQVEHIEPRHAVLADVAALAAHALVAAGTEGLAAL